MDKRHDQLAASIAEQVKNFYKHRKPFKVYHGSTNSTRILSFDREQMVDVSHLNRVLKVDKTRKVAIVEPNIPMDKLVEATLPYGLVPPVVMEFPGITVGGGLQGGAGESSSFKYGTFNRILNWYDIILADGRLVRASRKQHADLFWGGAGAYGSLGVVTAAEVQLIPAKTYVNLSYTPVHNFGEAVKMVQAAIKEPHDYIDGILFAANRGVIITGKLSNKAIGPIQTFTKRRDPWFYMHAEKQAKSGQPRQESVPIRDYLFRYDRGAFWMGKYAFKRFGVPFNTPARWALDLLMHTRRMYDALQASGMSQECIIQDLAIPAKRTTEFLEFVDKRLGFYPLWLCPLLPDKESSLLSSNVDAKAIINVGVWGLYSKPWADVVATNRELDQAVRACGGKKWLYAQSFYSEKEFWSIYGERDYKALRTKYKAKSLPDVYQKTATKKYTPVSGKRGLAYILLGRNGLHVK